MIKLFSEQGVSMFYVHATNCHHHLEELYESRGSRPVL